MGCLINKFYQQVYLNIVFQNSNTLARMFSFKDKIPHLSCSCVIYKYKCEQCSSVYIGETQKQLKCRILQHQGLSFRTGNPLINPPFSSIRDHSLNCNHPIKTGNFSILKHCNNFDIRILESLFIHKYSPNLNEQNSSFQLNILKWYIYLHSCLFVFYVIIHKYLYPNYLWTLLIFEDFS